MTRIYGGWNKLEWKFIRDIPQSFSSEKSSVYQVFVNWKAKQNLLSKTTSTFLSLKVNFQSEDITPSLYSIYKTAELQLHPRQKIKAEEVDSPSPNKSTLITCTDASHLHYRSHAHNRSLRQRNGISLPYPLGHFLSKGLQQELVPSQSLT